MGQPRSELARRVTVDDGQSPDERGLHKSADRLLGLVARHQAGWLALLGFASVVRAGAELALPAAVGRVLDALIRTAGTGPAHGGPASGVLGGPPASWAGVSAALVALILVSGSAVQLATGMATTSGMAWLRRMLARHVTGSGPALLRRFTTGDTVSRMVGGTAAAGAAPAGAVMAATAVVLPAGSVAALGLIDPWLVVAFAAGFPVLAWIVRSFMRDTTNVSTEYQRAQGAIATRLLDALGGARTIAAAGTADQEVTRILRPLPALRAAGARFWRIQARVGAQSIMIVPLLQVIILAVAGFELAHHRITPGEMLAASQYSVLAVGIGASISQLGQLARGRGGGRRAAEVLTCPPRGYGPAVLPAGPGRLEFRKVTVAFEDKRILNALDLVIPGGSCVAVVGRSGAGKSVLASLAGRLLDPASGEVTLDGVPLAQLSHTGLRQAVVYAFERPFLFGATLGEAIGFGLSRPSPDTVLSAARDACAYSFVSRLPDGMDTPLARAPLSGGEVQRLGLARAFAHAATARLIILDDATSSLDTVTEMQVSRVLTGQFRGRTRLVAAHRAATAARADLVAWLSEGRVRALRPHHELWADAEYRAVFGPDPEANGDGGVAAAPGRNAGAVA
jgi:ATP-binding cassette, subfamily B, bacterial RamA/AmfB